MSILGWLVLGLVSGLVACKAIEKGDDGLVTDIALGISGAILGGFLFTRFFGVTGVEGFNVLSMFVATGGAVAALFIYRLAARRPNT
jgi:uncharacterized membrane protein YeaQ/YmgE (transglycosylase-associated protein family)